MASRSISDALFTKTQQRVLGLLYGTPDKSFYTNEIVRWADMGRGTVRRELDRLASAGLLRVSSTGNQRHYQANADNPVYSELLGIVRKTFGVADVIREALKPLEGKIGFAFVYGSMARGEDNAESDIDLMVVTDTLSYADLMAVLAEVESTLGRTVNPSVYSGEVFNDRLSSKNAFISRVMEQPKLWIKGVKDDIAAIAESGKGEAVKT